MNKSFKFWLWKINIKTKRLDVDERIGYLANELVKELKSSGRSIGHDPTFGSLTMWVHHLTDEDAYVQLQANDWSYKTKPTFDKF